MGGLLTVISTICVITVLTVKNKTVRIICAIVWVAALIPNPDTIPYQVIGSLGIAGIVLIIQSLAKKLKE